MHLGLSLLTLSRNGVFGPSLLTLSRHGAFGLSLLTLSRHGAFGLLDVQEKGPHDADRRSNNIAETILRRP